MARALLRKISTDPSSQAEADSALAAQVLAYRGRVVEAVRLGDNNLSILLELALIGAIPAKRVERPLRLSAAQADEMSWEPPLEAAPWWAARRDTAALRHIAARGRRPGVDALALAAGFNASAYLALARQDTVSALRTFETFTDTIFPDFAGRGYTTGLLERARLLAGTGAVDEARRVYQRVLVTAYSPGPTTVLMRLELGELAERQGARELALECYRFVAAIWHSADPVLQPYVARARAGMARLEPRPPADSTPDGSQGS
jgi:hypothetical protein